MLPSIYDQMDPLSMSDVIQVHDDQHLHTANSLTDLEGRLKYLETKKYIPDKILLTKIFSDKFFFASSGNEMTLPGPAKGSRNYLASSEKQWKKMMVITTEWRLR